MDACERAAATRIHSDTGNHLKERPMRNPMRFCLAIAALAMLGGAAFVRGQAADEHAVGRNVSEIQFSAFPGMPGCSPGSVQSGDPAKGPSIILAKANTGCTVPWHWHTPNEHLMVVNGTARVEMKSEKPITLRAGGYAMLPAKHAHQFVCTSSCLFYVHSDGPFDIHYVNSQGNEISPDEALKSTKGAAATKKK
jgi:quercetin dioxygenase-like cupin family protein